jgi:hypothetical protein
MRQHVGERRAEQSLAALPVDAARELRHANHAVAETRTPRGVEARRRQHPDRRRDVPQRGDEGLELALDVGEGDAVGAVLDRAQRLRIEQRKEFQPAFRIVFCGANSAQRPGLE